MNTDLRPKKRRSLFVKSTYDKHVPMRITLIQPALPAYRRPLFGRMAEEIGAQFRVYSSSDPALGILDVDHTQNAWDFKLGPIRRFYPGFEWQSGAMDIPISRNDVVILCGAPRNITTLLLLAKCKAKGAKTIWWGQYWSATSKVWRARVRFLLMRLADAIMFYTEQELDEFRVQAECKTTQLLGALNNGIETTAINRFRAPYAIASRPTDLLFLGRITAKAELGLLLEALSKPSCAGVTLNVVGEGPELTHLKKRASVLGLAERIIWQSATTDEMEIAESANSCKVFVYPGAVGLSLIHGLTYGLPAIIHDNRWQHMPEVAAHRPGVNGVSFRQGNVDSLAKTISELLAEPVRMTEMSAHANDTTKKTFNTDDMAQRFVALIDSIK